MEEECQIFQIETDEFTSDRLDNKQQHNCSPTVHIANNEALCEAEQVEYENVEDESIYENNVYENSVYEESIGAENGTEESFSEENATKENIFDEENVADENVSEEHVAEENVFVDNISNGSVTEENTAEGKLKFVEDNVDEINTYETIATDTAQVDYEQGGTESLIGNDTVDSSEVADEIEHVDESDLETERSSIYDSDATPLQTTLPKSRPISVIPSRYSSLPSSSPSKVELTTTTNDNKFGIEKTVLGIDINAVHNAVLKGGTRIPESIVNEHPVTIYPGRMSASPTRKVSPNSLINQLDRPLKNGVNGNDSFSLESKDDSLQYHNLPSSVLVYNKQCPMSLGNDILQSPTSSVFTASNNNELMYISQPNLSMDKNSDLIDGLSLYSSSPPSLYSPPLPASPVTHSEPESLTNEENLTDYHTTTDDEENHFDDHERLIVNNDITDFHTHLGLLTRPSSLLDPSSIGTLPFSMDMCTLADDKVPLLHSKYDENIIPYSNNANGDAFLNIYDDKVAQFNLAELNFAHDEPTKNGLNIGYKPMTRTSLSPRLSSTEYLNERLPDNRNNIIPTYSKFATLSLDHDNSIDIIDTANNLPLPLPLPRISSLPAISPAVNGDGLASRRELSTPIEEDEEQDNTQQDVPILQIENNISALLRGDLTVARVREIAPPRTSLGFRPGTHKSESTKEMLLSQKLFGPLPPTPLSSSPEETDEFSPLPPSPQLDLSYDMLNNGIHKVTSMHSVTEPRFNDSVRIERPPAVPPHRPQPVNNALITRSMDAGFAKSYRVSAPHNYNNLHTDSLQNNYGCNGRRRLISGAFPKRSIDTNERRLQTSCSLPETPIFARCETISTPHKRVPQVSNINSIRPAQRQKSLHNSSMVDVGGKFNSNRHSACQELNSGEMLRLAGGPARGWYPKQRHPRLSSTENIERDSLQRSVRAWDTVTYNKKPLTLPPNFTPKFFNKSPRDTFRRVTSMLIRKSHGDKEPKSDKSTFSSFVVHSPPSTNGGERSQERQKKKSGFFKKLWKRSKHNSCD